ncbi:YusW-like protein [Evansella caseinilytica]|uniref:YusW-like protein n=1 Tax=Evansella caseinilytica TaxID=1503961 RepID=A0A1H3IS71_9BACI|nr:YusW family protein [Evansella caseinilytica]SDY30580.1 YusW-like protein [Evansella caseinilytica]
MKGKTLLTALVLFLALPWAWGWEFTEAAEAPPKITYFELEIEMKDNTEYEIEYEKTERSVEAKYSVPGNTAKIGEDAQHLIEPLLKQLQLTPDGNKAEQMNNVLSSLKIIKNEVSEFELEALFESGEKLSIRE